MHQWQPDLSLEMDTSMAQVSTIKLWNVCVFGEVRLLDEGIEFFWNLIHWLMGWIGWAGAYWKEECVGDVCCPQLSAAWSIPARRWSVLLMRNDAPSTVHSVRACVCVRVCVFTREALCLFSVCVSGWLYHSDLAHFFPSMFFSYLVIPCCGNFRDLKQLETQTPLHRLTPTPRSPFSTDCTQFHFNVWFLSCSITVKVFRFVHCTWLQWSVPWSLSICLSESGSRATTVCVAFFLL